MDKENWAIKFLEIRREVYLEEMNRHRDNINRLEEDLEQNRLSLASNEECVADIDKAIHVLENHFDTEQ